MLEYFVSYLKWYKKLLPRTYFISQLCNFDYLAAI
jgi:hypothetical protein